MSIATEIERIRADKTTIRNKLIALGLVGAEATLDACAAAIEGMAAHSEISVEILEGRSYTIPAGYHDGSGVVKAMTDTAGEEEQYKTQSKTVTPTKQQQTVNPDQGNYALSSVIVKPIPDAYQDVSATTAAAGDVLTGKVYVLADGTVTTGTMPNNGKVVKTLDTSTVQYVITAGYHSGEGTVSISLEEKSVTPTKSEQTVTPSTGKVLKKVTVAPIPDAYQDVTPTTVQPEDVREGMKFVDKTGAVKEGTAPLIDWGDDIVLDVNTTSKDIEPGFYSPESPCAVYIVPEEKSVTPTKSEQTVTPSTGKVLSKVTVAPIPAAYQDVSKVELEAWMAIEGYRFVDKDGTVIEGTMPDNDDVSASITGLSDDSMSVTVPAGYTTGGTISLTDDIENALKAI